MLPPPAVRRFLSRLRRADRSRAPPSPRRVRRAATLVALAGRWPAPDLPRLSAPCAIGGTPEATPGRFLELYRDVCRCLRSPADYAGRRPGPRPQALAASGSVTPRSTSRRPSSRGSDLPWHPVRDALEAVFAAHERAGRGRVRVLLDSVRQWGPDAAAPRPRPPRAPPLARAVGFGLGGDETAAPRARFRARLRACPGPRPRTARPRGRVGRPRFGRRRPPLAPARPDRPRPPRGRRSRRSSGCSRRGASPSTSVRRRTWRPARRPTSRTRHPDPRFSSPQGSPSRSRPTIPASSRRRSTASTGSSRWPGSRRPELRGAAFRRLAPRGAQPARTRS